MRGIRGSIGVVALVALLATAGVAEATVVGALDPSDTDPAGLKAISAVADGGTCSLGSVVA